MDVFLEKLQTAAWIYDIDQYRIHWANAAALEVWQTSSIKELYSHDFRPEISQADQKSLHILRQELILGKNVAKVCQVTLNGDSKDILCRFKSHILDGNTMMLVEAIPQELIQSGEQADNKILISTFQTDGVFTSANPAFVEEISPNTVDIGDIFASKSDEKRLLQTIGQFNIFDEDTLIRTHKGDVWHRLTAKKLLGENEVETILVQLRNIHACKTKELKVDGDSQRDPLTGLLNRKGMTREIRAIQKQNIPFVLFFIDLDGFKMINDTFGHAIADELLNAVSRRLGENELKLGIPGRMGGDEFLWVVPKNKIDGKDDEIAELLIRKLSEVYFTKTEQRISISASAGLVHYPDDGVAIDQLISSADTAMYRAKHAGRKRYVRYTPGMEASSRRRGQLIQELHRALENNEFEVYYQAIFDTHHSQIVAFESLLRWESKTLGPITTDETVNIAEAMGLIDDIEKWVISRAIAELPALKKATADHVKLSVNISGLHLTDDALPEFLMQKLLQSGLKPTDLNVELTESIFIENAQSQDNNIQKFIDCGITISIDDFGTGYSSLAYLHDIPAKTVKIDRSFIERIPSSETTLNCIHALIKSLGMTAIAEGIETQEQRDALRKLGITLQQGFFHSEPKLLKYYSG